MPDTPQDFNFTCLILERKLRALKRNILGIEDVGGKALADRTQIRLFKVKLKGAWEDWREFMRTWYERDQAEVVHGTPDAWPTESWQQDHDKIRDELYRADAILSELETLAEIVSNSSLRSDLNMTTNQAPNESHLPKIAIPSFGGEMAQWPPFKDTFTSMVHEEASLPNIKKFHYLKAALRGEAAALISRIPISDLTYKQAWEKLNAVYDNPRVLASLYLQRVLDCDAKTHKSELQRHENFLISVADGIEGFRNLKIRDETDFLLSFLALRALDQNTRRQFELTFSATHRGPTADEVISFVRQRCSAIKMSSDSYASDSSHVSPNRATSQGSASFQRGPRRQSSKYNSVAFHASQRSSGGSGRGRGSSKTEKSSSSPAKRDDRPRSCPYCKGAHWLPYCLEFFNLPPDKRQGFVRGWSGCKNCLKAGHKASECPSRWTCRFCRAKHHSLVHEEPASTTSGQPRRPESDRNHAFVGFEAEPSSAQSSTSKKVLLATVQLLVKGSGGTLHPSRAILDSGSQHSFISSRLAKRVGSQISRVNTDISGLGGSPVASALGILPLTLRPLRSSEEITAEVIVINKITNSLPSQKLGESVYSSIAHLDLADRSFDTPGPIDILIGADLYPLVVTGAPERSAIADLFLLPTIFGLTVIGGVNGGSPETSAVFMSQSSAEIETQLKAFWEIEEPVLADRQHPEEKYCEEHFLRTHSRTSDGRYVVRFPLKPGALALGDNREIARRRFSNLQSKLAKDEVLARSYANFMEEYSSLGHMSVASESSDYIIPHHGIWQGTKLRVVFDASCSSPPNRISLNDVLLAGPKLQQDITLVLTRFRTYKVPLCADMVKMYRQILVHPEDRHLQHIYWKDDSNRTVTEFELNTVTYGVKSSSFHALRVINQLVSDEGARFPLAAQRVLNDRFVDDFATGAASIDEALDLQTQLIGLLAEGGITLGKWASTEPSLIPDGTTPQPMIITDAASSESIKVLGLIWDPQGDAFSYRTQVPQCHGATKRTVLSSVARIFDPLGFLSPVIFVPKVLLQDIWKERLEWDDPLPEPLLKTWCDLTSEWDRLTEISVPRIITGVDASRLLVGFCDASVRGYSAAVYLRSESSDGRVRVSLVKAKTKVAPLKFLSIARLELCGALLLSRLLASIQLDGTTTSETQCFTDSTVVLSWLSIPTHGLRVFEANRVSQILGVTQLKNWHHIKSEENPCDLSSRGCSPSFVKDLRLWWEGPSWVAAPRSTWPESSFVASQPSVLLVQAPHPQRRVSDKWMSRFSRLRTLIRVVARILRLKELIRPGPAPISRAITASDFEEAKLRCVKMSQAAHYPDFDESDVEGIRDLKQLSPFRDELGIIRVGGRLLNSPLDHSSKHPVLIPSSSHLALLVIDELHKRHFHAGPSLTLALLRGEFWITRARRLIRSCIQRCVHCRLRKAKPSIPIMASLPKERFAQFRAFLHAGVDYAGPFLIKESQRRNAALGKAYLCIFVCMATRAVHLEAVSSLTTVAFLSALDRFLARRGLPQAIHSDHGSNFVGASRFLKDVFAFLSRNARDIAESLAPKRIEWRFIPPRAPHFGGLWEAGVKSVKTLLAGSVGKQPYTFEELATTFAKIEGLLNSRPLCPLTDDVENCEYLTPGHFLIGGSPSFVPEPAELAPPKTMSSKWQAVQDQVNSVWERWRKEYLHTLQQRSKWRKDVAPLKPGDLVILIEKRALLGEWPVARVVQTHPGKDGTTRVVTVKTPSGSTFVRAVCSLAPLFHPEYSVTD